MLELNSSIKLMIYPLNGLLNLKTYYAFHRKLVDNSKVASFLGK